MDFVTYQLNNWISLILSAIVNGAESFGVLLFFVIMINEFYLFLQEKLGEKFIIGMPQMLYKQ